MAPIKAPTNTLGEAILINFKWVLAKNVANREEAATAALPMAKPLVKALVVLPTASSDEVTRLAFLPNPAISTIPWALSEIGPKVSRDIIIPVVASIPMPARPMP